MDADVRTGALHFSVSENGSLTYLLGTSGEVGTLVWANANAKGAREELPVKPLSYGSPRVSPDRARIALDVGSGAAADIHVYDLRRDHLTRLTSDGSSRFPLWTPDGERIVFYSDREGGGLFSISADGNGNLQRLTTNADADVQVPYSWAENAKVLVFEQMTRGQMRPPRRDLYTLNVSSGVTSPLLQTAAQPAVSPDGRWMAYTSTETRPTEVYLRPFPNVQEGRSRISTDGGTSPLWSPDGKEILFISGAAQAMAVPISFEPTLQPGKPRVLFDLAPFYRGGGGLSTRQWDLADGKRFLLLNPGAAGDDANRSAAHIVLVLNWFEDLKRPRAAEMIAAYVTHSRPQPR